MQKPWAKTPEATFVPRQRLFKDHYTRRFNILKFRLLVVLIPLEFLYFNVHFSRETKGVSQRFKKMFNIKFNREIMRENFLPLFEL